MRVQFTVTDDEYKKLTILAKDYPDISSYSKEVALQDRTYGKMWAEVKNKIGKMSSGDGPFALRDLIPVPPTNMGVKLFKSQADLDIVFYKKVNGVDTYKKL